MVKSRYIYSLIILLFIFSCKKKELDLPSALNSPELYFTGQIDGQNVTINAGDDNYYLYSSYSQDSLGLYAFKSSFKQSNISNCPNSLEIELFNNIYSSPNAPVNTDSAFQIKNYLYNTGLLNIDTTYLAYFKARYNSSLLSYQWSFGDGKTSNLLNPTHHYSAKGKYNVCLTLTYSSGCVNSICNNEYIGGNSSNISIYVAPNGTITNSYVFSSINNGSFTPISYAWDFGDGGGFTAFSQNPSHTYTNAGFYNITLWSQNITDTVTSSYNLQTMGAVFCETNYKIDSVVPIYIPDLFSKVVIKWTNANGITYSSINPSQPLTSTFQILAIEPYKTNELNLTTQKVKLKFNCTLYNGANSIVVSNAEAVIAFAYK